MLNDAAWQAFCDLSTDLGGGALDNEDSHTDVMVIVSNQLDSLGEYYITLSIEVSGASETTNQQDRLLLEERRR